MFACFSSYTREQQGACGLSKLCKKMCNTQMIEVNVLFPTPSITLRNKHCKICNSVITSYIFLTLEKDVAWYPSWEMHSSVTTFLHGP
jgi:hypothetical protein